MSGSRLNVKEQLVEISRDYLGPAAERFIDRQIATHLKKNANLITRQDVGELIEWLKLSLALLTKNTEIVEEYAQRLHQLAEGQPGKALEGQWPT